MAADPDLTFRSSLPTDEPARSLIAAMGAEVESIYPGLAIDSDDMPKAGPAELSPPHGDVQVGYDATGTPVCVGALKRLPDGATEFKRMYVIPEARGRGLAKALLERLEERARELGYTTARLDTGPNQPAAEHLYRSAGYADIGNFNANPMASYWGEKQL